MALVTVFEINGYNKNHQILHYMGASLVGSIDGALIIQYNYNLISIFVYIFGVVVCVVVDTAFATEVQNFRDPDQKGATFKNTVHIMVQKT